MTRRYVLTGGASCGKTSLINELRKRGFCTVEESATEVILDRFDQPISSDEILKRQLLIFKRQTLRENYEFPEEVFLDRCLIDSFAYCKYLLNYVPDEIKNFNYGKYDLIFVLERIPLVKADHRIEKDDFEVEKIHNVLIDEYRSLGYNIVFVPLMPVEQRADFVIEYIRRKRIKDGLH